MTIKSGAEGIPVFLVPHILYDTVKTKYEIEVNEVGRALLEVYLVMLFWNEDVWVMKLQAF